VVKYIGSGFVQKDIFYIQKVIDFLCWTCYHFNWVLLEKFKNCWNEIYSDSHFFSFFTNLTCD